MKLDWYKIPFIWYGIWYGILDGLKHLGIGHIDRTRADEFGYADNVVLLVMQNNIVFDLTLVCLN